MPVDLSDAAALGPAAGAVQARATTRMSKATASRPAHRPKVPEPGTPRASHVASRSMTRLRRA